MSKFDKVFNDFINNAEVEAFKEGMFTTFYALESAGLSREKALTILGVWENNNPLENKNFTNLREEYKKFLVDYEEARKIVKDMDKGEL